MSEALEAYKRNVEWLKQNHDADTIYEFAEQALMCAEFFMTKWNEWVDIPEHIRKDKLVKMWVDKIAITRFCQGSGTPASISNASKKLDDLGFD